MGERNISRNEVREVGERQLANEQVAPDFPERES
jgi:hypothetical protein